MRFDLADLNLFRHVVEAGSITHGAERAHLALAAASTRVRNMEVDDVRKLVERYAEGRTLGVLGEPRVNVLKLNLALDGR